VALGIAVAIPGCADGDGLSSVEAYCSYGAVSERQLAGCIDHVTENDFGDLNTEAARYGRGEIDECMADAGPFCGEDEAVDRAHELIERRRETGAPTY